MTNLVDKRVITDALQRTQSLQASLTRAIALTGIDSASHPEALLILGDLDDEAPLANRLDELHRGGLTQLLVVFTDSPARHTLPARRHALERLAFETGWRKHPSYYLCVDYESLNQDACPQLVALERVPDAAWVAWPMDKLRAERDLHMDMTREAGERSDGHIIRYQLAAELIRPGDAVLDAASGLGYGSHVLTQLSRCASVLGIDGSTYAIDYGSQNFASVEPRLCFRQGYLPDHLSELADASFDVIVSFETLEHIENPVGLLAEFSRLLKPGGRIIGSVPNDWSDETGKDPNPHHLHVYTLDSLRQQFGAFFTRERLYQQIASGCKTRESSLRWTPLRRVLREVPVETAMPPDSEWWVMTGSKPLAQPSRHLKDPWYAALDTPWNTADHPTGNISNGVVLAMHCVPAAVDPSIEMFWEQCSAELAKRGYCLVLVSTTPVSNSSLNAIDIPYLLTDFPQRYCLRPSAGLAVEERDVMDVASWYQCPYETAQDALRVAREFWSQLLDTLRPAAVLGWQSLNPATRLLRTLARGADIPFWSAERGWVKNTLMLDTGENNYLSEMRTSLALDRLRERCPAQESTLQRLGERARHATDLGRYSGPHRLSREAMRAKYGIPNDASVLAFFNHGEPGLNALYQSGQQDQHGLSAPLLQARFDVLCHVAQARGHWMLVQEHPFNEKSGRTLRLPAMANVIPVSENVGSVVDAADHLLFSLATLQFEAAFLDKPFGLLSRSALYRAGAPPFVGDFDTMEAFLDAVMDRSAWPERQLRLQREIGFLYENHLIDIEIDQLQTSALRVSEHLAQFHRPVDAGFHERVERFVDLWSPIT